MRSALFSLDQSFLDDLPQLKESRRSKSTDREAGIVSPSTNNTSMNYHRSASQESVRSKAS